MLGIDSYHHFQHMESKHMEFYSKMAKENKKETDDESFAQQNVGAWALVVISHRDCGLWFFLPQGEKKHKFVKKVVPSFGTFKNMVLRQPISKKRKWIVELSVMIL